MADPWRIPLRQNTAVPIAAGTVRRSLIQCVWPERRKAERAQLTAPARGPFTALKISQPLTTRRRRACHLADDCKLRARQRTSMRPAGVLQDAGCYCRKIELASPTALDRGTARRYRYHMCVTRLLLEKVRRPIKTGEPGAGRNPSEGALGPKCLAST